MYIDIYFCETRSRASGFGVVGFWVRLWPWRWLARLVAALCVGRLVEASGVRSVEDFAVPLVVGGAVVAGELGTGTGVVLVVVVVVVGVVLVAADDAEADELVLLELFRASSLSKFIS